MKLSYLDKARHMKVVVENPNDEMRGFFLEQFRSAYEQGFRELMTDAEQTIRKIKKGQTILLKGYPLIVHVSRDV